MKNTRLLKTFFRSMVLCLLWSLIILQPSGAQSNHEDPYQAIPGLIDLRSTFSDGVHSIEDIVKMALSRGFKAVFINDHDRIAIAYGVPPFRNILRHKKEFPSIMTHGPENFLAEINRVSKKYPDTIIVPGCITSAYYYWSGSWFKGNLTLHEYDRRLLIIDFEKPDDYRLIPNLHNDLSLKYTRKLLPGVVVFAVPLLIGLLFLVWKGVFRLVGLIIIIVSVLAFIDYNPFRSSLFNAYQGDQGIAPFQDLIDYVNERGGLCFWNYPEQRSGARRYGPVRVSTPPYPEVLHESRNYTGFAAIYGDRVTITDPGKEWDRVLNEYCRGEREKAPWGISTADFHEDGRLGLKLGAFPTTFLVKTFSKEGLLEAIAKGRMYCSRADGGGWPRIDYFNVVGKGEEKAFMGETLETSQFPRVQFRVSYTDKRSTPINIHLIRGGELLHTFSGKTPLEVEYVDVQPPPGAKTYYRLMDSKKHLTSNPIFVAYGPAPQ